MPSSSSSSLSGRPGGLAAAGSVSGMNLYIPPYVEAAKISSGPPPGSGGFADLGLPSGHRHSLAGSINSMDALTRPMSGLSINTPPAQQTPPRAPPPQAYGGHGHRHSMGGPADAPWSHDMPQQPQLPALLRPVSAAQSSTGYTDPRRGTPQPYHDSRTTTPVPGIPNSLLPGQEPRPHAHSFSGPSRPIVPPPQPTYLQPSPGPTPPPHPSSAPPVHLQPHYQVPVSSYAPPGQSYDPRSNTPYQDVRQGLPQPPPSRSNSLPVRAPSPQPPPRQGYYPDRSYTPRPSYPGGQSPLPPQQTPPGYPPQQDYSRQSHPGPSQVEDRYQNNQAQQGYGQIPPPPEPAREPTPNNQGYIPWYQQTQPSQPPPQQYDPPPPPPPQPHYDPYQQHQQSYTPAPPVPPHRPASAQPIAPPRPAIGYYPSDELYAQDSQRNTYQPPQPPPRGSTPQPPSWQQQQAPQPPPRGSTPQPPSWQQQQQQQQQQRPVSPQPPIPGQWQQQQPDSYNYQNQAPPQAQQYDQRYPSPAPSQNYQPNSYPQQPTSSYPQQSTYPPTQSYPQAGYQPLAPSPPPAPPGWQSAIPQAQQPPRGVSPAPAPARAPSPLPTQMGQDWRSYLQSLPTPGRTPSPVPPPQQHHQQQQQYVPPPSLPSSLKPPEGWQSSVPTSNDGHQWKR